MVLWSLWVRLRQTLESGRDAFTAIASGQRPAASGITCARRLAGARKPASPSESPRQPDACTGRLRARPSRLLPALALLLGALGLLAPAPAQAQTTVWSATLTPASVNAGTATGCQSTQSGQRCDDTTILTGDEFSYGGTDYTIAGLFVQGSFFVRPASGVR